MGALSVSPDGRFIAFAPAGEDGNTSLWVRALDSEFAQELDRTSGASFPFWSPDSREIGFFSGGQLRRIPVSGGAPVTVAPAPLPVGGTWNQAGQIVFASAATGLNVVSASGGTPSPATTTEAFGVAPVFLPDGSHFVYGGTDAAGAGSFIQELGSGEPKLISRDPFGDFAAPNHLILVRNGTALAQDLDMATFEPEGEPFVLASDVAGFPGTRAAISVSGNGVAVIGTDRAFAGQALRVYQRDGGTREELLAADAGVLSVALSPDGRRLAVVRSASDSADITDLWLLDLESGVYSRLTSDSSTETDPTWSSDSTRVLYALRADDKNELRELTVGASAEKVIFANSDGWAVDDWTRDGQWIVFRSVDRRMHLLRYGEQQAEVVSEVTTAIDQTHVAPNGRWVAFNSTESGRTEVYVAAFPSFREKRQISVGGGAQPQWRADGRELYYLAPDSTLMAVEIESDVTLETGNRSALFRTDIIFNGDLDNFVPSPDGQSFYVVEPENEAQLEPRVIVNWPALRN
jgi:Tol biopolymer transport system component